jgi:hypothetical protein
MAMARKPSRDQKRKKKLAERRKKSHAVDAVVPYEGNKYREAKFSRLLFEAECAIREVDVVTGEEMTDTQVKESLEYFVRRLRGEDPEIPEDAAIDGDEDNPRDYLSECIQEHWNDLQPHLDFRPANADLGGVLRTIIDSLNTRTRVTPGGRGYLLYLGPFLEKAGFHIEPADDDDHSEEGDDLWRAGHNWIRNGDAGAGLEFLKLAEQFAAEGHAEDVVQTIEHLANHTEDSALAGELQEIRERISAFIAPHIPPPA